MSSKKGKKIETIRVLKFSGAKEDWSVWEEWFLARVKRKEYRDVLKGKTTVPDDNKVIDESIDAGKLELKARQVNENTYDDLIFSIYGHTKEGKIAFGIVKGCKTKQLPDRKVELAWTRLTNRYQSKSVPTLLKLKKDFTNSKFKDYGDPDEWITSLVASSYMS